jgi:hypothetical protein
MFLHLLLSIIKKHKMKIIILLFTLLPILSFVQSKSKVASQNNDLTNEKELSDSKRDASICGIDHLSIFRVIHASGDSIYCKNDSNNLFKTPSPKLNPIPILL